MKRVICGCVIAITAIGGTGRTAFAQSAVAASRLELRIVPVNGGVPGAVTYQTDNVHNPVSFGSADRTRRFVVQYHIVDPSDVVAGLGSMKFDITSSVSGGSLSSRAFGRSLITARQASNVQSDFEVPEGFTDSSGSPSGVMTGATGLVRSFRNGLVPIGAGGNGAPANGTATSTSITGINPLTLSQRDQFSDTGWYDIYAFEVVVGTASGPSDAVVTLTANPIVNNETGQVFAAYESGAPFPFDTGTEFVTSSASFSVAIPLPGSLSVASVFALLLARRSRR